MKNLLLFIFLTSIPTLAISDILNCEVSGLTAGKVHSGIFDTSINNDNSYSWTTSDNYYTRVMYDNSYLTINKSNGRVEVFNNIGEKTGYGSCAIPGNSDTNSEFSDDNSVNLSTQKL